MKKKNKIACLVACALITIVGGAKTFSNVQQDSTCMILLNGVEALSDPPEGDTARLWVSEDDENIPKGYCDTYCKEVSTGGKVHCAPTSQHKKENSCNHKESDSHLGPYCVCPYRY